MSGAGRPVTSVVREVLDRPADPAYAAAAERRRAAGLNPSTGVRTPVLLVMSVLVGLLLTVAASTLRAPEPDVDSTRGALQERIVDQQDRGDALARDADTLRERVAVLEREALADDDAALPAQVQTARVQAGATALQGPGLVVTLSDSPPVEGSREPGSRVQAGDLQVVANALWAGGAEGVAVNGLRLTSLSAIRSAGEGVVVDFRGVAPPYEVAAIGDASALEESLGALGVRQHLVDLQDRYGIGSEVQAADTVIAPPAARTDTRAARLVTTEEEP